MAVALTNHLAEHRRRLCLTQAELGRRVGLSRQAVHNVESGKTVPPVDVALRLARVVGEPVDRLFEVRDAKIRPAATLGELLKRIRDLRAALRERGVAHASIFGSYARGDALASSDVDVLLEPSKRGLSLFDLAAIQQMLERHLKHPVDVVTKASLRPSIARRIQRERAQAF